MVYLFLCLPFMEVGESDWTWESECSVVFAAKACMETMGIALLEIVVV